VQENGPKKLDQYTKIKASEFTDSTAFDVMPKAGCEVAQLANLLKTNLFIGPLPHQNS